MQNFFDILPEPAPTAVALGYFDGIHMGHKNVLSRAAYEKKNGLVSVCFTFSESPKSVLRGTQSEALMTNKEKLGAEFCRENSCKHAWRKKAFLRF